MRVFGDKVSPAVHGRAGVAGISVRVVQQVEEHLLEQLVVAHTNGRLGTRLTRTGWPGNALRPRSTAPCTTSVMEIRSRLTLSPPASIHDTDEGPGTKPGPLERIFEKFYRGGRPDGRKAGTGLGLSISRRLVEAMGRAIVAQSPAVRRRGTRIVVRLPAVQATPMAPRPPA
jgi:light-regulated signal transduction histidine kinase (bacteriophytochrome)